MYGLSTYSDGPELSFYVSDIKLHLFIFCSLDYVLSNDTIFSTQMTLYLQSLLDALMLILEIFELGDGSSDNIVFLTV